MPRKPRAEPNRRLRREEIRERVDAALYAYGYGVGVWSWDTRKPLLSIIVAGRIRQVMLPYGLTISRLARECEIFEAWAEGMGLEPRLNPQPKVVILPVPAAGELFPVADQTPRATSAAAA